MELRETLWQIYTAPHRDPKKMKKHINQFWPISKKGTGPTEEMIKAIEEAQIEYLKKKNGGGE